MSSVNILLYKYAEPIQKALCHLQGFLNDEYEKITEDIKEIQRLGGDFLILANLTQEIKNEK